MRPVAVGFGLGFLVAFQVGPMSLFLVRCTLRAGIRTGLAVGAGIACADVLYAAAGAAGASLLAVDGVRTAAGVVGAAVPPPSASGPCGAQRASGPATRSRPRSPRRAGPW